MDDSPKYRVPAWGTPESKFCNLLVGTIDEFILFLRNSLDLDHNPNPYHVRLQNIEGKWVFRAPDPWVKSVVGYVSKHPEEDCERLRATFGNRVRIVKG